MPRSLAASYSNLVLNLDQIARRLWQAGRRRSATRRSIRNRLDGSKMNRIFQHRDCTSSLKSSFRENNQLGDLIAKQYLIAASGFGRIRTDHAAARTLTRPTYRYDPPAVSVIQILRLTPGNHDGQYVAEWQVDVSADARLTQRRDAFGNITHVFTADGPLSELRRSCRWTG